MCFGFPLAPVHLVRVGGSLLGLCWAWWRAGRLGQVCRAVGASGACGAGGPRPGLGGADLGHA